MTIVDIFSAANWEKIESSPGLVTWGKASEEFSAVAERSRWKKKGEMSCHQNV